MINKRLTSPQAKLSLSPALSGVFLFWSRDMTQLILGWIAMIVILGGMAFVAYRSEKRGLPTKKNSGR